MAATIELTKTVTELMNWTDLSDTGSDAPGPNDHEKDKWRRQRWHELTLKATVPCLSWWWKEYLITRCEGRV